MTTELTVDDLNEIAAREADRHAQAIGIRRRKSKRPLWFLFVHSSGASLRITWFDLFQGTYSCGIGL